MDTTATPREIDEQLAAIDRRATQAEALAAAAVEGLHRALGERATYYQGRNRPQWPTTTEQALAQVRELADARIPGIAGGHTYASRLATYERHLADYARAEAEATPLNAEFVRRGGWSRFFVVQANGGHVHSSMECQTCNRSGSRTLFGWNPQLSGLSEAEAVAELGPRLCTVCFPSAPVEWTVGTPRTDRCPGSGQPAVADSVQRYGRNRYGRCPVCPAEADSQIVLSGNRIRAHKPAK
jgi:hypothetical protein